MILTVVSVKGESEGMKLGREGMVGIGASLLLLLGTGVCWEWGARLDLWIGNVGPWSGTGM